MHMTLAEMNAEIRKTAPEVELVRGRGYCYYTFDDGKNFESESVMVPYLYMRRSSSWIAEGIAYAEKMRTKMAERAELSSGKIGPIRVGNWVR